MSVVFFHKNFGSDENTCTINEAKGLLNVSFKMDASHFSQISINGRQRKAEESPIGPKFVTGRFSIKKGKKIFAKIYFNAPNGQTRIFNMFDVETKYIGRELFDGSEYIGTVIISGDKVYLFMRNMPNGADGVENVQVAEDAGTIDTMAAYSSQARIIVNQRRKKLHIV